jgi:hypothetical protein
MGAAEGQPVDDLTLFAIDLNLKVLLRNIGGGSIGLFWQDSNDSASLALIFALREGERGCGDESGGTNGERSE